MRLVRYPLILSLVFAGCGGGGGGEVDAGDSALVDSALVDAYGGPSDGGFDAAFSCDVDADCDDLLVCNGAETCDGATHRCQAGPAPDCSDGDDCTEDSCDDAMGGCLHALFDGDGDGHAPTTAGACGDDCDDTRDDVYPGAEELCDGVDNNCNIDVDELAPTWYVDCDSDGFAASTDSSRVACSTPPSTVTGCGGAWTSRRPVNETNTDCDDSNADMFPGQTEYFTTAHGAGGTDDERFGSYDCNGVASRDHTTVVSSACELSLHRVLWTYSCSGSGWRSVAPTCGGSGYFTHCSDLPEECSTPRCLGYELVCEGLALRPGDVCHCPAGSTCEPTCTPGTARCPWHYYRCDTPGLVTERMACR